MLDHVSLHDRAGPDRGARRRHRLGQVDADQPAAAAARAAARHGLSRRRRRARDSAAPRCAARSASCRRSRSCSPTRSPRTSRSACERAPDDAPELRRQAPRSTRRDARGGGGGAARQGRRRRFRRATTRWSASAASRCPAARSSEPRSPARVMLDPRILILDDALSAVDTYTEEEILARLRGVHAPADVDHRLAPRLDGAATPIRSSCSSAAASPSAARHDELVRRGGLYARSASEAAAARRSWRRADAMQNAKIAKCQIRHCRDLQSCICILNPESMSIHDEEVLGKAYDAVLMRRLLRLPAAVPAAGGAGAGGDHLRVGAAAGAAVPDEAGDRPLHRDRRPRRPRPHRAGVSRRSCSASFALEYLQTWMLQMTGQRIMFDMRMQIYGHLQRLDLQFYDRNPVGRLMTRVTTDVDVLNDMFTAGVVSIFGDMFTLLGIMIVLVVMDWRLALVAFSVLPLIVARDAVVPAQRARVVPRPCAPGSRGSTRSCRSTSPACRRCSCSAASARSFERFDEINRAHRDANVESIFYYAVFYPAIEVIGALAAALIIWFGGGWTMAGHADARLAGRVPAVFAAVLPADQRHVGEVQRPAGGDGVVGAHLQAARHAGEDRSRARGSAVRGSSAGAPSSASSRIEHRVPSRRPPTPSGHIVFDHVWFAYNGDGLRAAGRLVRGAAGRAGRHRRRDGGGQVDADQPAAALLRRDAAGASSSTASTSARWTLDELRRAVQPGAAGRAPVLRHDRRRTSGWATPRSPTTQVRAAAASRCTPTASSSALPLGYDQPGRRARRDAVGRAEAAAVVRPGAGVRPARSWSWTRRRRASTPRPSCSSATRCTC